MKNNFYQSNNQTFGKSSRTYKKLPRVPTFKLFFGKGR